MKTQSIENNMQSVQLQPKTINREEKRTTRALIHFATLLLFAITCLHLAAIPASAQCTGTRLFFNGDPSISGIGDLNSYLVSFQRPADGGPGFAVSSQFLLYGSPANCFTFLAWEYPGDTISSVYWSLDSNYGGTGTPSNPNTHVNSGIAMGPQISQKFLSTNAYGYSVDWVTVSIPTTYLTGTNYLTLSFGMTALNLPLGWDDCSYLDYWHCRAPAYQDSSSWALIPGSETFALYGP
jgi:hypothetical protein